MITIVKTEISNSFSVQKSLTRIGYKSKITDSKEDIKNASMIILPGVGSFDALISSLNKNDLITVLSDKVQSESIPTLGICLGMHVMTNKSEEGKMDGLGFVDAIVKKFDSSQNFKVPHFGWNSVKAENHLDLIKNCENKDFYFAHSYYVECKNKDNILFSTEYGKFFCSGFINNNIIGLQFHPEKSNKSGLRLLDNILRYFNV